MSNLFCATLDIQTYDIINYPTEYSIEAKLIDNTGNYIAKDAKVGNIIYINNSMNNNILRYRVTSVSPKTTVSKLFANIEWDEKSEPLEPLVGYETVIGESSNNLNLANLVSSSESGIGESFINSIKNYENFEIIDKLQLSGDKKSYTAKEDIEAFKFVYLVDNDTIAKADCYNIDSADKIIGVTLKPIANGEIGEVQISGKVNNPDWHYAHTGPIFINKNGDFSANPMSDATYIEQLGLSISETTIDLDMEEAIII